MIQKQFAEKAKQILADDENVIGLAVGGSWITNEMDEYSDLDLVLVTKKKIPDDKNSMLAYAEKLGNFLCGFTGEHVGEPRLLICLYENPLLHVDIKFLTLQEFHTRVETPVILLDKDDQLETAIKNSRSLFPYPDYQWIEDRFWTWIHYALLKIGRGEYLEALDFFGFLRMTVFGPLIHIRNKNLPRGVRKVETSVEKADLTGLLSTIPGYNRESLLQAIQNSVNLYRELREELFDEKIILRSRTEKNVMEYFEKFS
jgi:predicted nucleotidyltransferase